MTKEEHIAELTKILILQGHITYEEILPLVKEGTSRMLGEPKDKIFKE